MQFNLLQPSILPLQPTVCQKTLVRITGAFANSPSPAWPAAGCLLFMEPASLLDTPKPPLLDKISRRSSWKQPWAPALFLGCCPGCAVSHPSPTVPLCPSPRGSSAPPGATRAQAPGAAGAYLGTRSLPGSLPPLPCQPAGDPSFQGPSSPAPLMGSAAAVTANTHHPQQPSASAQIPL